MEDNIEDIKKDRAPGARPAKQDKAPGAKPSRQDKAPGAKSARQDKAPGAKSATPGVLAEHTVISGDTLSGIAQKYYGAQTNWKAIYEANKELIGDNPSLIRLGQVFKIPKLD